MSIKQVVLIDAKNLVFRHNAVNGDLSRGDGFPTGAIHGCLNTMVSLSKHFPNTPFVWVWDGEGETWRHKFMRDNSYLYTTKKELTQRADREEDKQAFVREPAINKKVSMYKANRAPKEKFNLRGYKDEHKRHSNHHREWPEDSKARGLLQIPVLRMLLDCCGFRSYQLKSIEADDLIAIITRNVIHHTNLRVIIHSGDKDFYQLMGKRVSILSRIEKGKPLFVDAEDIRAKYGVSVKDWAKFRAWMGDPSDNIPHIRSIGPVAARNMINEGLDPSLPLREISDKIARKFRRYFEPEGIVQAWPFAQANYSLCKLVTRSDHEKLSHDESKEIKHLLRHLHFRRDKHKIDSEHYRRMSHVLMRYELKYLLSKRTELWRIP